MSIPVPPRMRDVADRCGVSESTVSHVLNGTKTVSPKTRDMVLRAMREMNYHRDSHARRLARGHSDFLGLIISDIENPFYPGLLKAFESAALEKGYEVLLCTTNYDAARTDSAFRRMIENKVPGVAVMTSRVDPRMAAMLAEQGVASVFLDSDGSGLRKSNIRLDYANGANEAVRYLHNLGHRRFALIAGPQQRASHAAYRRAVESALKDLGMEPQIIEGDNTVASGEVAVQRFLTAKQFPTAIICSNDLSAMGAMRGLLKCGMQVPGDVSVVGADDIPFAALAHPPLTTVRMPREKLGALAIEILIEMLAAGGEPGREMVLETSLVIRESTGPGPELKKSSTLSKRRK